MTPNLTRDYFRNRLEANRELAKRSTQPAVRDIHQQYVRFYQALLDGKD